MLVRILASFLLLFSVLFMPFWLSVLLAVFFMFYFNIYWEAIVVFFLSDLLYGVKEPKFNEMIFVSLVTATIALLIIEALKKKLKYY